MEKKFSDLTRIGFLPYVSSAIKRGECGRIRALRYKPRELDCWPFDLNSLLIQEKIHRSIQKGEPLDDTVNGHDSLVVLFPGELVSWMACNSIESISDQWVSFFASWHLENPSKRDLAFDQSPSVLYDRIEHRQFEFSEAFDSASVESRDDVFSSLIAGMPPWLDIRNYGNVDGVCSGHSFRLASFGVNDGDIERSIELKDTLENRSEADRDAFVFWWHSTGGKCWPRVPGIHDSNAGVVYLVYDGELFKIGFTKEDPQKRLASLQTGNPNKLQLVGHIAGTISTERSLHRHFSHKHVRGEWFALSAHDIRETFGAKWPS